MKNGDSKVWGALLVLALLLAPVLGPFLVPTTLFALFAASGLGHLLSSYVRLGT